MAKKAPKLQAMMMASMPKDSKAEMAKDKKMGIKQNPIESKETATKKKKKLPWIK